MEGNDPHNAYGKWTIYPANQFDYHLIPWKAAIQAGTGAVMGGYMIPVGKDTVGANFSKAIATDLLRGQLHFQGVMITDTLRSMPWGVEHLSQKERHKTMVLAGVDQILSENDPKYVIECVREGSIPAARLDVSARRILTAMFELGLFENPYVDPDLKVRTALDRAAARIPGKFQGQPEVEAAVRETLGKTYFDLGRYEEACAQLDKVFEYSKRTRGPSHSETLHAELQLAGALSRNGRFPRAGALFREVLDTRLRMLGPQHPDTMRALTGLAVLLDSSGKRVEAERLLLQGYETLKRALGPEHTDTLAAMTNLADVYRAEAKFLKAEALYVQVLEARQRLLGPEHPLTLDSMNHVAAIKRSLTKRASESVSVRRRTN